MRSITTAWIALLLAVAQPACGGGAAHDAGADAVADLAADATRDAVADGIGDNPGEVAPDAATDDGLEPDARRDADAGSDVVCQCAANADCASAFLALGPCERAVCDPDTCACIRDNAPEDEPCEDGNPCTEGDACRAGACRPGANRCACATTLDCAPKEDGDLCNGTLVCVNPGDSGSCQVDPATIVACTVLPEPCRANSCNPVTGKCEVTVVNEGKPCDDLDPCTIGDTCVGGVCTARGTKACDDDEPCTTDACEPGRGCVYRPNQDPCDDGDPCTVGDTCAEGHCVSGTPNLCDDRNACTLDHCDAATGACVHVPRSVDDFNPCTTDVCDPMTGQVFHRPVNCDDGLACDGAESCDPVTGACVPGTAPACDDGNPCTDDACTEPSGECVSTPVPGRACDDGNACTDGDACNADGNCVGTLELCCGDLVDNDGDGLTDCQDPDCASDPSCTG